MASPIPKITVPAFKIYTAISEKFPSTKGETSPQAKAIFEILNTSNPEGISATLNTAQTTQVLDLVSQRPSSQTSLSGVAQVLEAFIQKQSEIDWDHHDLAKYSSMKNVLTQEAQGNHVGASSMMSWVNTSSELVKVFNLAAGYLKENGGRESYQDASGNNFTRKSGNDGTETISVTRADGKDSINFVLDEKKGLRELSISRHGPEANDPQLKLVAEPLGYEDGVFDFGFTIKNESQPSLRREAFRDICYKHGNFTELKKAIAEYQSIA